MRVVEQIAEVAKPTETAQIAHNWSKLFKEGNLTQTHFRNHWKSCVPRAFISDTNGWQIVEDILQQLLINPLQEFINLGETQITFSNNHNSNQGTLCSKIFKIGEPLYSCTDCCTDPTCVMCLGCFNASEHKKHKYKMGTSTSGGFCDCGDVEAWKSSPYCNNHSPNLNELDSPFTEEMLKRIACVFEVVLYYIYEIQTLDYNHPLPADLMQKSEDVDDPLFIDVDQYCTVLYNDENHTYDHVINTLTGLIKCNKREAIEFATKVDREGRAIIITSNFDHCTDLKMKFHSLTGSMNINHFKVVILNSKIIAHQMFAKQLMEWLKPLLNKAKEIRNVLTNVLLKSKVNSDEGEISLLEGIILKDYYLWKSVQYNWQQLFMLGMFVEQENKVAFAKTFIRNYETMIKDIIMNDQDYRNSIIYFSIQIFSVQSLAHYLIAHENVLSILLNVFINECSTKLTNDGNLFFDHRTSYNWLVNGAYFILADIKYILRNQPNNWTDELRNGFLNGVSSVLILLSYMQGMDTAANQLAPDNQYGIEWNSSFNLHLKVVPIVEMILAWCTTDLNVLKQTYLLTLNKLLENRNVETNKIKMDIKIEIADHVILCNQRIPSTQSITIHLPLTRFLAGLYLQFLDTDSFHFDIPDCLDSVQNIESFFLPILVQLLSTQYFIAQVRSGIWRSHGYSLTSQILFYRNYRYRKEMLDKDVILIQIAASIFENNEFIIRIINEYGLVDWAKTCLNEEDKSETILIAEEFLFLLIAIIGERFVPGVGKVTEKDCQKNEIIHQLFLKPLTHSEIINKLSYEEETDFESIFNQVATYEKQASGKYVYIVKEDNLKNYNKFFYHYSKEEMSKSEEELKMKCKNKIGQESLTPPTLPPFTDRFAKVANLLHCDVLLYLMKLILERALNSDMNYFSDIQLEMVLHLIGYALQEEEQQNYSSKFEFTSKANKWNLEKLLEKLSTDLNNESNKELINFIWKKYSFLVHKKIDTIDVNNSINIITDIGKKGKLAKLAAEKRAEIMCKMAAQQQMFIKQNTQLFNEVRKADMFSGQEGNSSSVQSENLRSNIVTCIICQENETLRFDGPALGLAAFLQKSTVLCRRQEGESSDGAVAVPHLLCLDANQGPATHASTCGHAMHSTCWAGYIDGILSKKNQLSHRLKQLRPFDVEYLCPLCKSLSNAIIPIIPELSENQSNCETLTENVSFSSWLGTLMNAISLNDKSKEEKSPNTSSNSTPYINLCIRSEMENDSAKNTTGRSKEEVDLLNQILRNPVFELINTKPGDESRTASVSSIISNQVLAPLNSEALITNLKTFLGYDKSIESKCVEKSKRPELVVSVEIYRIITSLVQAVYVQDELEDRGLNYDEALVMMTWRCCAYTVHSTERVLRYTNKSLLGDFTNRHQEGLKNLIRCAGILGKVWKNKEVIHGLGTKLLITIVANKEADVSLYDWDCFGLLVPLIASSLYVFHENYMSTLSLNFYILRLLLLVNMAQGILLSDLSSFNNGEDIPSDKDTLCLQNLVKIFRHITISNTLAYWEILKKSCLTFLRSAAIFFHFLINSPATDELKTIDGSSYESLCKYLGLPTTCEDLLGHENVNILLTRWSSHPRVSSLCENQILFREMAPLTRLVNLPNDYSELINSISDFTCPNSNNEQSANPTLCLICGQLICSLGYCCHKEIDNILVGACNYHCRNCGAGVGIFLRVRYCEILLLGTEDRGCLLPAPYLDDYGESDQGLFRGNPLHLSQEMYNHLQLLWLTHGVQEQIIRINESGSQVMPNIWLHY